MLCKSKATVIAAGLALLSANLFGSSTFAQENGPMYASKKTEQIMTKVFAAHGKIETWRKARTISYTNVMSLLAGKARDTQSTWDSWDITEETFELATRRGYHNLVIDQAQIANDGKTIWSKGLEDGNPPSVRFQNIFYFVNLPWVTHDPGVHLGEPGMSKLPKDDKEYITIKMTFAPGVGNNEEDYHLLYIDPETYLIRASEYNLTHAALLDAMGMPAEMKAFGPLYRIFDGYSTVDGLTVPARFRTFGPDGSLFGHHLVLNINFNIDFDESRLDKPAGAMIDDSNRSVRMAAK